MKSPRSPLGRIILSLAATVGLAACSASTSLVPATPFPYSGPSSQAASVSPELSTPGPLPDGTASSAPTPALAPSSSPEVATATTPKPTARVTSTPTARPTAPPTPRVWRGSYSIAVLSPVKIGGKGKVTIGAGASVVCSVKVRYPSGQSVSLAPHTFAVDGRYSWTWIVPKSAGAGTASVKTVCTYFGTPQSGTGSFTILPASTPIPAWGLTGTVAAPGDGSAVFGGHISGTPPPGATPIDLGCVFIVTDSTGNPTGHGEPSIQTRDFQMLVPVAGPRPWTWSVECYPPANRAAGKTITGRTP